MCIGRRFAELELGILVIRALQTFRLSYTGPEVGWVLSFTSKPDRTVNIKFSDRWYTHRREVYSNNRRLLDQGLIRVRQRDCLRTSTRYRLTIKESCWTVPQQCALSRWSLWSVAHERARGICKIYVAWWRRNITRRSPELHQDDNVGQTKSVIWIFCVGKVCPYLTDNILVSVDLSTLKYPQACMGFKSRILLIQYFKYCLFSFCLVQRRVSSNSLLKQMMHSQHLSIELVREINQMELHKSWKMNPISCKIRYELKLK